MHSPTAAPVPAGPVASWDELADSLSPVLADLAPLVRRVVDRVRARVPAFTVVPPEALLPGFEINIRHAVLAVRDRRPPTADELARAVQVAEEALMFGLPVEAVQQGYREGVRATWDLLVGAPGRYQLAPEVMLEATHLTWDWADAVSMEILLARQRNEVDRARRDAQLRTQLLELLTSPTADIAQVGPLASALELDATAAWRPVVASPRTDATARELGAVLRAAGVLVLGEQTAGLVGLTAELGPVAAGPFVLAVGEGVMLGAVPGELRRAVVLARTAGRLGWTGVVDARRAGIWASVGADDDVGPQLAARALRPLREAGAFGQVLESSLACWFRHARSVPAAARTMHIHPNTLRHRLDRIRALTGLDPDDTQDGVTLWWALAVQCVHPSVEAGSDVDLDPQV